MPVGCFLPLLLAGAGKGARSAHGHAHLWGADGVLATGTCVEEEGIRGVYSFRCCEGMASSDGSCVSLLSIPWVPKAGEASGQGSKCMTFRHRLPKRVQAHRNC